MWFPAHNMMVSYIKIEKMITHYIRVIKIGEFWMKGLKPIKSNTKDLQIDGRKMLWGINPPPLPTQNLEI